MIHAYHGFFGRSGVDEETLPVRWPWFPLASSLARFRREFALALDRAPLEGCEGGVSGFRMRQEKYH